MLAVQQTKTGHVGLNVSDLDRSRDFYQQVFGFRVIGESRDTGRRYAFLGTESKLEIYSPTGANERSAPDAHGPTCGFF